MTQTISLDAARRIALAAQGFHSARGLPVSDDGPPTGAGIRSIRALIEKLGVLQIDSVNVLERSHYLPVFARLGPYRTADLDRLTHRASSGLIEYWGHEATFMPTDSWPLWRWKMVARREKAAADPEHWSHGNRPLLDWLLDDLAANGPQPASAVEHEASARRGPWWGWSDVKRGLEVLFAWGLVVSAGRTSGFERIYALPEQVVPAAILDVEVSRSDAVRALVSHALRATGLGTSSDIADYYRLPVAETRQALLDLEDEGEALPVVVRDARSTDRWRSRPAWIHRDAHRARRIPRDALLSPFDPVVWTRGRAERLFDFRYRIEIYTPAPRRVYGYYVLPVLLDGRIAARVDLKSDRHARRLLVQSSWLEPGAPTEAAPRLAALLRSIASWQGHDSISVGTRGDFVDATAAELGSGRHESP
ncbi:winged helix-turn-helix domain-containing protein [Labedella populi]|uniref:Winged helix-turn-helix domain-containing protein n=1 Tax=Labedella populi TaxID=2498850 RepID=A0A3S3ZQU4_9MICO|nr:crosslink repair DNA glycosylase YcaQ family protein [Labedella populi]RWZ64655.1 winged helix-turn-helix domain-containing protein [Labedella populi]